MDEYQARVGIVGGGIIGLSIAFELAKHDVTVTVLEQNRNVGLGATSAALGGITPQSEYFCRGPLREIAVWSTELYTKYISQIALASGSDIPIVDNGQLQVALSELEMRRLITEYVPIWDREGFVTHQLSRDQVLAREPLLGPSVAGALLLPIEIAIEPRVVVDGLLQSLNSSENVEIRHTTRVTHAYSTSSHASVQADDGSVAKFDVVILASGLATRDLSGALTSKIYPMRGQAMELWTGHAKYALSHHIYAANGGSFRSAYLVPRADGRVSIGVTYEPEVELSETRDRDIQKIVSGCSEVCPSVRGWTEIRRWSGIRPASRDGRPFIGNLDDFGRLLVCAGHQGLGVTLAPVSAHLIAALCSELLGGCITVGMGSRERAALKICDPTRTIAA